METIGSIIAWIFGSILMVVGGVISIVITVGVPLAVIIMIVMALNKQE